MTQIQYIKGDVTYPTGDGKLLLCHVCNDCRRGNGVQA
jgi:hypothetical protein